MVTLQWRNLAGTPLTKYLPTSETDSLCLLIKLRTSITNVMIVKVAQESLFAIPWTIQYSPWNSPGQNTAVGSLSLLQRIFPTQGSNPGLPHRGRILYQLSHKGSPRILQCILSLLRRRSREAYSGIEDGSPALQADSLSTEPPGKLIPYLIFLPKILGQNLIVKRQTDKLKLRDILQSNWTVLFKTVKAMKEIR